MNFRRITPLNLGKILVPRLILEYTIFILYNSYFFIFFVFMGIVYTTFPFDSPLGAKHAYISFLSFTNMEITFMWLMRVHQQLPSLHLRYHVLPKPPTPPISPLVL